MNVSKSKWLLATLLLVPVVLAGCGTNTPRPPTPTPVLPISHEPPALDGGWTLATMQNEGFALALPPGWIEFDLTAGDLQSGFSQMSKANPSMASILSDQIASLAAQGIKLYAVESSGSFQTTGFASNLNVVKEPVPAKTSLDALTQQSLDEMKQQLNIGQDVKFFKNRLNINSGEAERVQYSLNMNTPTGKSVAASFSQYIAINGGNAYILTYTTTEDQFAQYSETFDKSAKSLTFLSDN